MLDKRIIKNLENSLEELYVWNTITHDQYNEIKEGIQDVARTP